MDLVIRGIHPGQAAFSAWPDLPAGQWVGGEEPALTPATLTPVSIWEYSDYRAFLKDSFAAARAMGNPVSNRWLARRLGFKSFSFITMLLQGKRNLTRHNRVKFSRLLGLDPDAEAYFAALVEYNQAKDALDRERALQALGMLRKPGSYGAVLAADLRLSTEGLRRLGILMEEFRIRAEALTMEAGDVNQAPGGTPGCVKDGREYRLDIRWLPLPP